LKYTSLGLQLLVTLGALGWVGYQIDRRLGLSFPVFLLSFLLLAFAGMLFKIYRSLNE